MLLRPLWWRGIGGFFPTGTHLLASLRAGLLQSTIAGNPLLGYFTPAYLRAIGSFSCRQSIIFSLIFPIIRGITPIFFRPKAIHLRLLHNGESLRCYRDSASVTYASTLPSTLTLSALCFIHSAKSKQDCEQSCDPVAFCNSLHLSTRPSN